MKDGGDVDGKKLVVRSFGPCNEELGIEADGQVEL